MYKNGIFKYFYLLITIFLLTTPMYAAEYKLPKSISFTANKTSYTKDGKPVDGIQAPYIDAYGNFMIPLLQVSEAFGVTPGSVLTDKHILTLINQNDTVVQFKVGFDIMLYNGAQVPMNCKTVESDGVIFVPAKYLGIAYKYDTSLNTDTETLTFSKQDIASAETASTTIADKDKKETTSLESFSEKNGLDQMIETEPGLAK